MAGKPPPENFIAYEDVFGDLFGRCAAAYPEDPEAHFWEYIKKLGLNPARYEVTKDLCRYGWLIHRKDNGRGPRADD